VQTPSGAAKPEVQPVEYPLQRMTTLQEEEEEAQEATPIELFYDLFFVANLTTVTGVHYITEKRSKTYLSLYIK
jgi:low temperature requirement protein LtrA